MEKRLVTAVLVSIVFLWLWAWAAPKLFPDLAKQQEQQKKTATTATTTTVATNTTATSRTETVAPPPSTATLAAVPAAIQTPIVAETQSIETIDTPDFTARFSNRGAELVSFKLKHYTMQNGSPVDLVKGRPANATDYPFAVEATDGALAKRLNSALYKLDHRTENGSNVLEYRYAERDGVSMTKTFRIGGEYLFGFTSALASPAPVKYRLAIGPGIRVHDKDETESRGVITGNGVVQVNDSLKNIAREKAAKVLIYDEAQFVGIEDNFFLTVLKPDHAGAAVLRSIDVPGADKNLKDRQLYAALNANADGTLAGSAFFGPKQTQVLDRYGFERALQYGTFGIIARFFLFCLLWLNKYTHNYGWAIIVLTICIKVVLYPLQHKWMLSMKKMQKLAPKQEAIKAKYKKHKTDPDQRQKMNVEMMKLYQQEGVNPAGGCLPILIQFPIFVGFYNLLSHAIELRGQPWILWIHDLSLKDPYYITPILMTAAMFVQQMITPSTADPAQKRMFMFMPLIFGFIFKEFPSGLVLYWLVQNILTIVQQVIMNRWNDPDGK